MAVGEDVKSRLLYAKQAGIMASKLLGIPGLIFKIIPGGSPKEIISVEYIDRKKKEAGIAVLRVKKIDATGIKRHIDLKANLDEDWYRKRNAKEEKARRDQETKTNHGTLTVEALTKARKARTVYI